MRAKTLCALALVAAAAWGGEVRADEPAPSGNWFSRWFGFGRPANRNTPEGLPAVAPMAPPVGDARSLAIAAYHRRSEVCLQLQKIALETKDDDLYQQAEQLANEIWLHYMQVMDRQPGP